MGMSNDFKVSCINHESIDHRYTYTTQVFQPIPKHVTITCAKLCIVLGFSLLKPNREKKAQVSLHALGHQLRKSSMLLGLLLVKTMDEGLL